MNSKILYGFVAIAVAACNGDDNNVRVQPDTATAGHGGAGGGYTATAGSGGVGGAHSEGGSGGGAQGGAGGTSNAGPAGYVSGSRLRARFYDGADGSRQFFGWYDSQLGVNCSMVTMTDGKIHCIPQNWRVTVLADNYFSDSACTQQIAMITKGCTVPYLQVRDQVACNTSGESRVHAAGSPASSTAVYYSSAAGSCIGPANHSANFDAYVLGTEIPPAQFVEATERVE